MATITTARPPLALRDLSGPNTDGKQSAIDYSQRDPRYAYMLRESARHQWPVGYETDLWHWDLESMRNHPDTDAIWCLRDMGTQLFWVPTVDDLRADINDEDHSCRIAADIVLYHSGYHRMNYYSGTDRKPRFYLIPANGKPRRITWQVALSCFVDSERARLLIRNKCCLEDR